MTDRMYVANLQRLRKEAMIQGGALEKEAERWRMESELAYSDAGDMKQEGRDRAERMGKRLTPSSARGVDVHTNAYKAMADAKGDFVLFGKMANTYANLAAMKYAKASALSAEIQSLT